MAKTAIGAGFGTAAVTLIVQVAVPAYRDWRHRKRQAAYLAMRLAIVLEAYAAACQELLSSNSHAEGGEEGSLDSTLPELAPYPDDADGWKAIDVRLAGRCLAFRNRIFESQKSIDGAFDVADSDVGMDVATEMSLDRGLEAWAIATALRRAHAIEDADPVWDYAGALHQEREKRREAHTKDLEGRIDGEGVQP